MKRIIIIFGILIILALVLFWLYLLSPGEDGESRFALFDFGDTTDENIELPPIIEDNLTGNTGDDSPLRQLTTKPVVGYREVVRGASSTPEIFYVEAGTSHVYSINSETFQEERISNTTVTDVRNAEISRDGNYVVLHGVSKVTILSIPRSIEGNVSSFVINETVSDISIVEEELLYLVKNTNTATVRQYGLGSKLPSKDLFTIPFREATVAWGGSVNGPHYFYPTPAADLEGYLYSFNDGFIRREQLSGFGLSALVANKSLFYTAADRKISYFAPATKYIFKHPIETNTLKCGSDQTYSRVVCGVPDLFSSENNNNRFLLGVEHTADRFFVFDVESGRVLREIPLDENGGLRINVMSPSLNVNKILFRDGTTNNLWRYEIL